jgi:hypothetical protein
MVTKLIMVNGCEMDIARLYKINYGFRSYIREKCTFMKHSDEICMQCYGLKYLDETHIKKHGDEICMQCHGPKYLDETHVKKNGDEIHMQCHAPKYLDEAHIKTVMKFTCNVIYYKYLIEIPMQSLYQSIWIKFSKKTPPDSGF